MATQKIVINKWPARRNLDHFTALFLLRGVVSVKLFSCHSEENFKVAIKNWFLIFEINWSGDKKPFFKKSLIVKCFGGLRITSWSKGGWRVNLWCCVWLAQNAYWLCQPTKAKIEQKKELRYLSLNGVPWISSCTAFMVKAHTVPCKKIVRKPRVLPKKLNDSKESRPVQIISDR